MFGCINFYIIKKYGLRGDGHLWTQPFAVGLREGD